MLVFIIEKRSWVFRHLKVLLINSKPTVSPGQIAQCAGDPFAESTAKYQGLTPEPVESSRHCHPLYFPPFNSGWHSLAQCMYLQFQT